VLSAPAGTALTIWLAHLPHATTFTLCRKCSGGLSASEEEGGWPDFVDVRCGESETGREGRSECQQTRRWPQAQDHDSPPRRVAVSARGRCSLRQSYYFCFG